MITIEFKESDDFKSNDKKKDEVDCFTTNELNNITLEFTFSCSLYNDLNSIKIYQYAIQDILNFSFGEDMMLHFNENRNEGNMYSSSIDGFFCKNKSKVDTFDYPKVKIITNEVFVDTSIIIKPKKANIYLKDIDNKEYELIKFLREPPTRINKLILSLEGCFEYYNLE